MNVLDDSALCMVSGGTGSSNGGQADIVSRGLELCKGLPDEKSITITLENTTSGGLGSTSGGVVETISFTLTCEELREAAKGST